MFYGFVFTCQADYQLALQFLTNEGLNYQTLADGDFTVLASSQLQVGYFSQLFTGPMLLYSMQYFMLAPGAALMNGAAGSSDSN